MVRKEMTNKTWLLTFAIEIIASVIVGVFVYFLLRDNVGTPVIIYVVFVYVIFTNMITSAIFQRWLEK
jgi:VIT1/CCC1 family predicted Fe2+/Mn2+ transporter